MGFGFWNEEKYFKIELLFIIVDVLPSSLVPGQIIFYSICKKHNRGL